VDGGEFLFIKLASRIFYSTARRTYPLSNGTPFHRIFPTRMRTEKPFYRMAFSHSSATANLPDEFAAIRLLPEVSLG